MSYTIIIQCLFCAGQTILNKKIRILRIFLREAPQALFFIPSHPHRKYTAHHKDNEDGEMGGFGWKPRRHLAKKKGCR